MSSNSCFVDRFPKRTAEIHVIQSKMAARIKFKFQNSWHLILSFRTFNAYFQFSSTNFKFTEDFQLFNDSLFQQWRVPLKFILGLESEVTTTKEITSRFRDDIFLISFVLFPSALE